MDIHIESTGIERLRETDILQQTSFWSEIKRRQGIDSGAFTVKVKASGLDASEDLLILFQRIGDGSTMGYVPYGPEIDPNDGNEGTFLEELSESLRPHVPSSCVFLRYDLLWESPWARDEDCYDENENWLGPPGKESQELRLNIPTHNWNLKKADTDILPSDTVFLDLGKEESRLLAEMKPKTRYNIGLSDRKGVRVRTADIREAMNVWYRLYAETCSRNRLFLHPVEYFHDVLRAERGGVDSPAEVELLIAQGDGKPLSAMFLAVSGRRASYLYGASSSEGRNLMAAYALQWEAIKRARLKGCTEYDMFGVAPSPDPSHPLYGLYRFKTGFGGYQFHRMGCWDYPFDLRQYDLYRTAEMNSQGYHLR